jgi:serine/threonine protein kinase
MAPEQIEGAEADPRTDTFAFGALLFEMLTGRTAFEGKTRASLLSAVLKDEPRPEPRAFSRSRRKRSIASLPRASPRIQTIATRAPAISVATIQK